MFNLAVNILLSF